MNNKVLASLVIVCSIFGGVVGAKFFAPKLGGDFAGGIVPQQLFTTDTTNHGITPIGNLNYGFGGTAAANQVATLYTATANFPVSSNVNLGPITAATSTATTTIAFSASGFSVGDACNVSYNGTTSTNAFGADGFVTAVSGSNVTATVTFWNGANFIVALTPTSTATNASSVLKATCFHTGV